MTGFEVIDILTAKDHRGWVSNLLDFLPIKSNHLKNIHIVSMEPGTVRGNHVHARQTEGLCVLGNNIRVRATNMETGEQYDQVVDDDPPKLFLVKPTVAHSFKNEGDKPAFLVCFTDQTYDFDKPDVTPVSLLE